MKFAFTLFVAVLCFTITHAQFNLAPTVGVNLSSFGRSAESPLEYTSLNGFYAGAHARYQFTDRLGITFEGQFSQKGSKGTFRNREYPFKARISYIDLLPGVEYKLLKFLSVNAGVNSGFELSEYYETTQVAGEPYISLFKSPNFGSWIGAKVYLNKLFVKFHYNHGLTNLGEILSTDASGNPVGKPSQQYDRTYQVGLGYYLF